MKTVNYRSDIDGLRALAVLPVVLFHVGFSWLPGGFVGVDMFFVISGFLISRIIISESHLDRFSYVNFYQRRLRRIFPALLVVIFASVLGTLLVATPEQVKLTSESALAAYFSVANIYFWMSSGYFSPASEFMPLLHTWSLSVEEQFYLFFPLFLLFMLKSKLNLRFFFAGAVIILCFFSVYFSYTKPSAAFYLLPTRAWELALGAFVAVDLSKGDYAKSSSEKLSLLGLILILFALLYIDSSMVFPGWAALFPCVGTALIIRYSKEGMFVHRLLSFKLFVLIGLMSYSLYLWHWPIIVLMRMINANIHLSISASVAACVISLILSFITWKWVEKPFRSTATMPIKKLLTVLFIASLFLFLLIAVILNTPLAESRLSSQSLRFLQAAKDYDPLRDECLGFLQNGRDAECSFGTGQDEIEYIVVGDSHAAAIRPLVELLEIKSQGSLWWRGACPLLDGAIKIPDSNSQKCAEFKAKVFHELEKSDAIKKVYLGGRWLAAATGLTAETGGSYRTYLIDDEYKELDSDVTLTVFENSLKRTINKITSKGVEVVIIGQVPEPGFDVPTILALADHNNSTVPASLLSQEVEANNKSVDLIFKGLADQNPNVSLLGLWDLFCEETCSLIDGGIPLYTDDDHITYSAAVHMLYPKVLHRNKHRGYGDE